MPQGIKNIYHLLTAFIATLFFRYPAKNLTMIGVTGTDGKTTTVHLIYEILKAARKRVSMISSVGAEIGGRNFGLPFHVTTPSPWQLQKFLRLAVDRKDEFLVLEVTSHGLDQNRVFGCNFSVGVITNITHEHLDYHKTFENYLAAKAKLFQGAKWAILNREDGSYENIKYRISLRPEFTPRVHSEELRARADIKPKIVTYGLTKGDVTLANFPFQTVLPGDYNKLNCLAAITAARALGIPDAIIRKAVADFNGVIGRFKFVKTGKDFRVVIDFAHTPNALEKVLSTIKPMVKGRLIHVFGAAGERDWLKRPKMGEISARYADVIILTEEDYRTEDVNKIMEEIEKGSLKISNFKLPAFGRFSGEKQISKQIQNSKYKIYKIPDRQAAISQAVRIAKRNDLILLTGKGHEKSLCRGKTEYLWDEFLAVHKALKQVKPVKEHD